MTFLLLLLTTFESIGERQNWLWVIDPSESPFHYLLLIVSQVGTVIGSLVLGCSVYSHRHD